MTVRSADVPADVRQILDALDAADAAADALVGGLSDARFNWQPDGGARWSIGQCLEHLAITNELYGAAMAEAVARARRSGWQRQAPLQPGFFGRRFVASLEPPVKRRVRAPSKIRPASTLSRAQILARYRDSHAAIREVARNAAAIDANRATFRNPFLGVIRVKVATGLHVVCAHERRHLWQAEQVRLAPGFPPA